MTDIDLTYDFLGRINACADILDGAALRDSLERGISWDDCIAETDQLAIFPEERLDPDVVAILSQLCDLARSPEGHIMVDLGILKRVCQRLEISCGRSNDDLSTDSKRILIENELGL